jgi:hypothetical protein
MTKECTVYFACRTSELVALMAVSTTLFLFIHTRELHTKLKAMEVKLQPEDMLSGKCAPNPFDPFRALTQIPDPQVLYTSNFRQPN